MNVREWPAVRPDRELGRFGRGSCGARPGSADGMSSACRAHVAHRRRPAGARPGPVRDGRDTPGPRLEDGARRCRGRRHPAPKTAWQFSSRAGV